MTLYYDVLKTQSLIYWLKNVKILKLCHDYYVKTNISYLYKLYIFIYLNWNVHDFNFQCVKH